MDRSSSHSGRKVIKRMGRTTTKRIIQSLAIVVFTLFGNAYAQTNVTTRIVTVPQGLYIQVDGQTYQTPLTFLWPEGSRHTLNSYDQASTGGMDRYQFTSWTTNKA